MATVPWGTEGKNKAPTSSHVLSPQDPNVLHISATYIQKYRPQALVLDGETEARLDGPVYWVRCLPAQGRAETRLLLMRGQAGSNSETFPA